MSGRPLNVDRQGAIQFDLKTYTGIPHAKCGTTERYVSNGGCVHCARQIATEQREARKYLKAQAALADMEEKINHDEPALPDELDIDQEMVLEEIETPTGEAELEIDDSAEARAQQAIEDLM